MTLHRRNAIRRLWVSDIASAALGGLAITFQVATMLFMALLCEKILAAVVDKLGFSFLARALSRSLTRLLRWTSHERPF